MSNDAIQNYKNKLSQSKSQAENGIRSAISGVIGEISAATKTLEANGQKADINIEEIISDLNTARDEWLGAVKAVFDAAITSVRSGLKK